VFNRNHPGDQIKEDEMSGGMWHIWVRDMVDKPEGKNHMDDQSIDSRITPHCILKKQDGKVWVGFIWLSIETSDGLFRIQQ
jgi:hypothetical protein